MPRARVQNRTVSGVGTKPEATSIRPGEIVLNTTTGESWTTDGSILVPISSSTTIVQPTTVEGEVFKVRGQAGDYQIALTDDYTLIVCVTGSTVVIPEGVPFPAGFRLWLRQDHASEYVYVKAGGTSINLTSYQSFTGTAGQYATIELINLAGSNWLLRGEGAVKSEPAAPSTYVPNTGIKFSDGNYFSDLNLDTLVADSKQFSFRGFVKLAQLTGGGGDPGGDPPATNFTVMEQLLSPNRPSGSQFFNNWGIHGHDNHIHTGRDIWTGFPGGRPAYESADPFTDVPLQATIEGLAASQNATGYEWAVLDLEQYPSNIWNSASEIDQSIVRFVEIANWYKGVLDADKKFGFYSSVPSRRYFNYLAGIGSSEYTTMQTYHDRWQSLVNVVDGLFPSAYYVVDNPAGMVTTINGEVAEGIRLAAARPGGGTMPIYHYLWGQNDVKNTSAYLSFLPGNLWRQLIDASIDSGADGFIIWGLWRDHFPSDADNTYCNWENVVLTDWWAETLDFMSTRVATQ